MALGDLTTLSDVRSLLGIVDEDQTDADDEIQSCITSASRAIRVYVAQEFVAPQTGSMSRVFEYRGGGRLPLQPYSLRSLVSVEVDTDTDSPTTLVENSDYYALPRGANLDGVYEAIDLVGYLPANRAWREVTITGVWGYASIPSDVARAAAVLAAWWYRNQSTVPGASSDNGDRFGPFAWPTAVLQLLASYRVIGFGQ